MLRLTGRSNSRGRCRRGTATLSAHQRSCQSHRVRVGAEDPFIRGSRHTPSGMGCAGDLSFASHLGPSAQKKDLERSWSDDVVNIIVSLATSPPTVRGWWLSAEGYREAAWT